MREFTQFEFKGEIFKVGDKINYRTKNGNCYSNGIIKRIELNDYGASFYFVNRIYSRHEPLEEIQGIEHRIEDEQIIEEYKLK